MAKHKENGVTALASLVKASQLSPSDAKGEEQWPTLMECLLPIWKDGKCKRQSGHLRIRLTGSWFVATLSCPTEGMETSVSSDTLSGLLDALEAKLRSPECQWTPDWESVKKTRQVRIDKVQPG